MEVFEFMEKSKLKNNATKKLQDLVKVRKTPVVVTKQGSLRKKSNSNGESVESYCNSDYNT